MTAKLRIRALLHSYYLSRLHFCAATRAVCIYIIALMQLKLSFPEQLTLSE